MKVVQPMSWQEAYSNGLPLMDQTHQGFIEHFNAVLAASKNEQMAAFIELIEHTELHFDQENQWMSAIPDFPACHRAEHDRVLEVLLEIKKRTEKGDQHLFQTLIKELPLWFENHVNGMDAALAFHMSNIGFDPTQTSKNPSASKY